MKKLLVIRNDKIGDFMLAWPSFAMLKASMPYCHITALVPSYTVALAKLCPWIDDVITDPTKNGSKLEQKELIEEIKSREFDASLSLFSTTYNALLVWKSRIPYRLAPATKLAQIFCNQRIKQKRSQSAKPEFEYNLDLIRAFLTNIGESIVEPQAPYLVFDREELTAQKGKLAAQLDLSRTKPWVYIHAGSGGSANNLSLIQYTELACSLEQDAEFILTAGPGEEEKAKELQVLLTQKNKRSVVYDKNDGLVDFSRSIACADLFIAGSTGPLHIAAAIDVPTVGFFPSKRSATPLRWKPINAAGNHIAFCPPQAADKESQDDMSRIDISALSVELNTWVVSVLDDRTKV